MPFSESHRAVFVWIPKTAGTSLGAALESLGVFRKGGKEHLWGRIPEDQRRRWDAANWQHLSVQGVQAHLPGSLRWDDCFSFSFVRNPWDRMVSFYEYSKAARSMPGSVHFDKPPVGRFEEWLAESAPKDQLWYLKDASGRMPIDFIGRFETLETDFGRVCDALGRARTRLPTLRASARRDYHDYYDAALAKRVADRYAEEIETFRYVF